MLRYSLFTTIATCVTAALVGCDVSPMYRDRQSPKGPHVATVKSVDAPPPVSPGGDAMEADLVEDVAVHRAAYREALSALHEHYRRHGVATKANWAAFELKGLDGVKAFQYLTEAEVPTVRLKPAETIAEADTLYTRGLDIMRNARQGLLGNYHRDQMVEAAGVFRELIDSHPSSDKIDDAAYQLGVIHKEYLPNQDTIAVQWFERAWTWDPNTPYPARFEAAVICDYRLHDRARALELYQRVLKEETGDSSNVRHATRRIAELSERPSAQASR
jgi:hypothetical protein